MKKEVLLAVFLGIGLGAALVLLARYHQQLGSMFSQQVAEIKKPSQKSTPTPTQKAQLSPTPSVSAINLSISQPVDNAVVNHSPITIKGRTAPGATVVLIGDEDEAILVADKDGNFETEFKLSGGANDIEATAYNQDGAETKIVFTVTYSTAKF